MGILKNIAFIIIFVLFFQSSFAETNDVALSKEIIYLRSELIKNKSGEKIVKSIDILIEKNKNNVTLLTKTKDKISKINTKNNKLTEKVIRFFLLKLDRSIKKASNSDLIVVDNEQKNNTISENSNEVNSKSERKVNCTGLPKNAEWNIVSGITQTMNGTKWLPKETGDYNITTSTNECRYKCNTNYSWNGTSCEANTQIVACSGGIPANASATTGTNYTQTWNGSSWSPTIIWGENQSACDFNCNSNYTWNGTSCITDTQMVSCGGTMPPNSTATTGTTYAQTWNGYSWSPSGLYWGRNQSTCNFSCNLNYTWNGSSCEANTQISNCLGSIPTNASATTGTSYTQTWNGSSWSPNGLYWGENQSTCDFTCNLGYEWNGSSCIFIYPSGCDTPDIVVGNYTISACNVGTFTAGTLSYGNYYQWGRNDALWTTGWTAENNAWGNTTNTNIARQGPCSSGYHVPSSGEWDSVISAGGWSGSNGGTDMMNTLKLQFNGLLNSNAYENKGNSGYYWSSTPSLNNSAYYFRIQQGNYGVSAFTSEAAQFAGLAVRCFKN